MTLVYYKQNLVITKHVYSRRRGAFTCSVEVEMNPVFINGTLPGYDIDQSIIPPLESKKRSTQVNRPSGRNRSSHLS
jgi:hypothetical protein